MKKTFKKALKPQKPFEVWAQENNVQVPQPIPSHKKKVLVGWVCTAACLVLCLAFILPFALGHTGTTPVQDKIYSSQDAVTKKLTLEDLYKIDGLMLFNKEQLLDVNSIMIDKPIDNDSLVLSYSLFDCLIMTSDEKNAFYVDYKIRLYKNYKFYSYEQYENLIEFITIKNTTCYYNLHNEGNNESLAYIRFADKTQEYFLRVKGFEDVTTVNVETLTLLLTDLIG